MGTLSVRDAAAAVGVSPSTVSRWLRDGLIRVAQRGGPGRPTLVYERDVHEVAAAWNASDHRGGRGRRSALRDQVLA